MAEGDLIRIIPHRGVDDDCGSLELWFADGRESIRFYWDNLVQTQGVGTTALTVALRPNGQVCVVGIPCRARPVYLKRRWPLLCTWSPLARVISAATA
jgi:hypothetical protein